MDLIRDQYLFHHPLVKANSQEVHPHEILVKGHKRPVTRLRSLGNLMYCMVILAHHTVSYLNSAKKVDLKCSHRKQRNSNYVMGIELVADTLVIVILRFTGVSSQHPVHLKLDGACLLYLCKAGGDI